MRTFSPSGSGTEADRKAAAVEVGPDDNHVEFAVVEGNLGMAGRHGKAFEEQVLAERGGNGQSMQGQETGGVLGGVCLDGVQVGERSPDAAGGVAGEREGVRAVVASSMGTSALASPL